MISVDTIYQRVLAMANKEQRGYITPQEFNLLANQAQLQIFESYFYNKVTTPKSGYSTKVVTNLIVFQYWSKSPFLHQF